MKRRLYNVLLIGVFAVFGLTALLTGISAAGSDADVCVAPGGVGSCYASIQEALDAVDTDGTVKVSAGTYIENLSIERDVTLLGGYDDASFSTRTPRSSIIDGNQSGSVLKITDSAEATVDGFTVTGGDATSDRGQGGGILVYRASATIVDNLIEGNVANTGASNTNGLGGGIAIVESTDAVGIRDNVIRNNVAISITASTPVTQGYGWGGGIGLERDGSTTIAGNLIIDNRAIETSAPMPVTGFGGGIGSYSSERISITGSNTIRENSANDTSGNGFGGGITLYHVGYADLIDNEVVENLGSRTGGFSSGGGLFLSVVHTATVSGNLVSRNIANKSGSDGQGGGLFISSSSRGSDQVMTLIDNTIEGNIALVDGASTPEHQRPFAAGGGVRVWGGDVDNEQVIVRNNRIRDNRALTSLVLSETDDDGYVSGGGLNIERISHSEVISNTIEDNIALRTGDIQDGGAASGGGIYVSDGETVIIDENRLTNNTALDTLQASTHRFGIVGGGLAFGNSEQVTVTGNLVEDNTGLRMGNYSDLDEASFPQGGGLFASCWSTPDCSYTIAGNRFVGNVTVNSATTGPTRRPFPQGGALALKDGRFVVMDNWIEGNKSYLAGDFGSSGGAIDLGSCQATLVRNTLLDNSTGQSGDGKPVVNAWESNLTSSNNLFAMNSGGVSGGAGADATTWRFVNDTFAGRGVGTGIEAGTAVAVTIFNTIIVNHETGLAAPGAGASIDGDYNLLNNDTNYASGVTPGEHDLIDVAPEFVSGGYRLLAGSPAIDAGQNDGAPATDLDAEPRPTDGNLDGAAISDIGAYEFQPVQAYLPVAFSD